ncbi:YfhO family protein [Salinicoccus sp. YB14-2]|uniref:YfhO family protein n=1 Tax=Salinicoccus sp. YB14-2 TaxID=1572701 RepID=UPI0009E5F2CB
MCIVIYSWYFLMDGSFIWESDGFTQHFQLFHEYVNILQGVLRGEGFPEWDWSIGAGADTITSYGYYVIGDPFVYLGVFFPESLREFSFHLIMFVRMWCVGLSYLIFVRKFKVSHGAALLGALMYTFSFFVIYNTGRHPFFILPLIWYPLLCLGVEKILKRESGLLFSIMVAVSAIVNFYFFYKLTILVFIYGVVRYGMLYRFKDWKQLGYSFGRCSLHYFVGLLLGAVLFLPMVDGFLNSSRNTDGTAINLFLYQVNYYISLVHNLFVPDIYLWTAGGLSIFTLFTVAFLFKTKKNKTFSSLMLLILGVFLLFPFFGSFMNGMAGPYNRFSFAIPLFIAFASGQFLEERNKLQVKDLRIVGYILIGFTFIYGKAAIAENMYLYYASPVISGWAIWFILMYEKVKKKRAKKISIIIVGLVILNLMTNATNFYYPYGNNSISKMVELNTSADRYENLFGGVQNLLPEDDLYRVGVTSQDNHVRNQFIYHDLMGLSSYLSITNGSLSEFAEEMELSSYQIIQPLRNGLDDRRIANHFFNIEYILTEEDNASYLPYGYEVVHRSNDNPAFIVAKTEAAFPFAYVEDRVTTRENFSELNPVEKETFLTQGVVLENNQDVEGREIEKAANEQIKEVEYQIEYTDPGLSAPDKNLIEVADNEARLKINLENADELAGHDIFIYLQGLEYETTDTPFYKPDDTSYDIRFLYEDRKKTLRQSDKYSFSTYFHRENMFVNLGHTDMGTDEMFIQFEDTGRYNINDITIYALPADNKIDQQIAEEKWDNELDIKVFENERIEGNVQREEPGVLVTTIPYEKGWNVTVNGEERDTVQANIGFIGVPLDSGNSEIVFSYQSPYLKSGGVLSLIGIFLLGLIQLIRKKNNSS